MKTLQERKNETFLKVPLYFLQRPISKDEHGDPIYDTERVYLTGEGAAWELEQRHYAYPKGSRVYSMPGDAQLLAALEIADSAKETLALLDRNGLADDPVAVALRKRIARMEGDAA